MTHKNKRINIRVSKKEGQGEKNMKPIKRQWMYGYDHTNTIQGTSLFIATGETPKRGMGRTPKENTQYEWCRTMGD